MWYAILGMVRSTAITASWFQIDGIQEKAIGCSTASFKAYHPQYTIAC